MVRQVWRDPVIAALVSKAAATKQAIVNLARAGCGADAYALTRVLFENVVVVTWLCSRVEAERKERIDTHILHFEAFLVRYEEVTRELNARHGHQTGEDFGTTERGREIAAEVFQDRWMYWAWMPTAGGKKELVRLRDMADDAGLAELYNRDYFTMSAFVHSAPASVFEHSGGPSETLSAQHVFTIRPELFHSEHWADTALNLSNILMWGLLITIDSRFELGLWDKLRAIQMMWVAPDEPTTGNGAPE